jgi:hypothetical protein
MTLLDEAERRHRSEMSKRRPVPYYKKCRICDKVLKPEEGTVLVEMGNSKICDKCYDKNQAQKTFSDKIRIWD